MILMLMLIFLFLYILCELYNNYKSYVYNKVNKEYDDIVKVVKKYIDSNQELLEDYLIILSHSSGKLKNTTDVVRLYRERIKLMNDKFKFIPEIQSQQRDKKLKDILN